VAQPSTSPTLSFQFWKDAAWIALVVAAAGYGLGYLEDAVCNRNRLPLYLLAGSLVLLIAAILVIPKAHSCKKYVINGLLVLVILSVFGIFNISGQYPARAHNSEAKSNLHNLYVACHKYWAEHGGDQICRVDRVATPEYGFNPSSRVILEGQGTEVSFTAAARHECRPRGEKWVMDAQGTILRKE